MDEEFLVFFLADLSAIKIYHQKSGLMYLSSAKASFSSFTNDSCEKLFLSQEEIKNFIEINQSLYIFKKISSHFSIFTDKETSALYFKLSLAALAKKGPGLEIMITNRKLSELKEIFLKILSLPPSSPEETDYFSTLNQF